jgi:hypothetical protein
MSQNGFLESFNHDYVGGWVKCNDPSREVQVVFNDTKKYAAKADINRPDLPPGCAGFKLSLPSELRENYPLKVSCFDSLGAELTNSPRIIETRSEEISKVLAGKEGWLFLANDTNASLAHLCAHIPVDTNLCNKWVDLVATRKQICEARGVSFIQAIVAEKETVYSKYLPEEYVISERRMIALINEQIQARSMGDSFYYGPSLDQEESSDEVLYYKGDTHFTYHGSFKFCQELLCLAATKLAAKGATAVAGLENHTFSKRYQAGDLLAKVSGVNIEEIHFPDIPKRSKPLISTNEPRSGRVKAFQSADKNLPRLLMFHTSSVDWMIPYLNQVFGPTLYMWSPSLDEDLIDWFQPDIVITQTNERFLTHCPRI